ncbi:MAG TPA: cytochrome d ubiquinol oxidase subunit II, partial [Candidatus Polarisedimenticolaceae bacterium]|nr:cytochrome d ubiquinol oxidase subunit II [Candidatus Polarisedimenticolaceae bacterium]
MDLHVVWFALLAVLLTGYAILDGFDLGVGILHPLARGDGERRLFVNAIGPLWDGNEVWLVTFGGALFAIFPEAYATIFSGFYLPFMLLLFALITRAVSLEFRGKLSSDRWRRLWDHGFFASSLTATLLFGVAVGNGMRGVPLNERGLYVGGLSDLVGPYQLLVGLLAVSLFAMHGAIYLFLKTEGAVQQRLGRW